MKFLFFSATNYGRAILQALLQNNHIPEALFSIPEYFSISYAKDKIRNYNFFDFSVFSQQYNIPLHWVQSPHNTLNIYKNIIQDYNVDFMLVAGWYYKIPSSIYGLSQMGAFGFHNSLLPAYAGGAPLVWAMIEGQDKAGVTLFRMNEEMDAGDIIAQKSFEITFEDTIADVLHKAQDIAVSMSLDLFCKAISFSTQEQEPQYYPQRCADDGKINFEWDSLTIYNFIRAQSFPYPGAFFETIDGKRIVIDKAHIVDSSALRGGGGRIKHPMPL